MLYTVRVEDVGQMIWSVGFIWGTYRMVQKTSPINIRCKSLGKKKMITRVTRFALDKTTFIMGRRKKTISFIKAFIMAMGRQSQYVCPMLALEQMLAGCS